MLVDEIRHPLLLVEESRVVGERDSTRLASSSQPVVGDQVGSLMDHHGDASQSNSGAVAAQSTRDVDTVFPNPVEFGPTIIDPEGVCSDIQTNHAKQKGQATELPSSSAQDAQANQGDSMTCPICMEPWTGDGTHRICCLACGHLFGRSCIKRWLKQAGKKNGKCPHCNRKARVEDIRPLYVPFITVVEEESQQLVEEVGALRAKNQELAAENEKLNKEFRHLQGLLAALPLDIYEDTKQLPRSWHFRDQFRNKETVYNNQQATKHMQDSFRNGSLQRRNGTLDCYGFYSTAEVSRRIDRLQHVGLSHRSRIGEIGRENSQKYFQLQDELPLAGAKVFDIDAFSQMLLVAQKSPSLGNTFFLNKISLLCLSEVEVVPLPPGTGAVRDVQIAGANFQGRLALVASLGKRLSLFSLESNNIVLTYNLQSPSWSCAWDPDEPNCIYAGLQDGSLVIFDLRQTSSPLKVVHGLSRHPVHTLHSVNECSSPQGSRRKGILSASSNGVCFWDETISGIQGSRPLSVDNQGICVALAYSHLSNVAVSTFRPKPVEQQPGATGFLTAVESTDSGGPSSQMGSQMSLGLHPVSATHFPMTRKVSTSMFGGEPRQGNEDATMVADGRESASSDIINETCLWQYGQPMTGYVSPAGMHRSAIICGRMHENASDTWNLFAFGDEESKALWLWDMKTLSVVDCLKAHHSPVLDVKSVNIGDQTVLGCASMTALQIYKH